MENKKVLELLKEMRNNCMKEYGEDEYVDQSRFEKAKALDVAIRSIEREVSDNSFMAEVKKELWS